mmetsp:Transcript_18975/g.48921  ORF Transcript_18975/g.48921 Transcript_18975/m.48921 type:complete len:224 (+) Transcript_18975:794-1465(+)
MPSFSRTWFEPVPKDSSPQRKGVYVLPFGNAAVPESIRLPKNFQPVGTSNASMPRALATRSSAHDVGIERAHALRPPFFLKKGIASALAAITASESDGVTKNWSPRIMLRSASPSAAAPNLGGGVGVEILLPVLSSPIFATSSTACVRLGSAWPCEGESCPPKSGLGTEFIRHDAGSPSSSQKIFLAYGPCTPCIESYTSEKSARPHNALSLAKSKQSLSTAT